VNLTDDDVRDILALIDGMRVNELHLRTARFELFLRRADDGEWTQDTRTFAEPALIGDAAGQVPETPPAPREGAVAERPAAPHADDDSGPAARDGLVAVRAPLLGTFYRAPKPGAPPFVEVGDPVTETTVVGIVETMKLMNSVYAGTSGTVAEICVGNGEFADQDATLILVDPGTP
jgi:acetyl-CoA carboxylase biotin carboxyl carrier protein